MTWILPPVFFRPHIKKGPLNPKGEAAHKATEPCNLFFLPTPALPGSGSKGISQPCGTPVTIDIAAADQ